MLYHLLGFSSHHDGNTFNCYRSYFTTRLNRCERTITRCFTTLKELDLITIERKIISDGKTISSVNAFNLNWKSISKTFGHEKMQKLYNHLMPRVVNFIKSMINNVYQNSSNPQKSTDRTFCPPDKDLKDIILIKSVDPGDKPEGEGNFFESKCSKISPASEINKNFYQKSKIQQDFREIYDLIGRDYYRSYIQKCPMLKLIKRHDTNGIFNYSIIYGAQFYVDKWLASDPVLKNAVETLKIKVICEQ